jgi:phosphoglycolate phosphatase-like HAD superfamily hydrolase
MISFTRQKDFLVGIDSDGCAFDTMELKHKECFIPNIIYYYNLQGVSKYAREVAEFVNLYSKSRGINRFPALIETLERLRRRPEVKARQVQIRIPESLKEWIKKEKKLGNPALEEAVNATGDADLKQALEWSRAVNRTVEWMVKGVPPFPYVRESLQRLCQVADIIVVSATPEEALKREWAEHGLDQYVRAILGQESGTKKDFLALGSQYPPGHTLMVGDAPGDQKAAEANSALFFPINPGKEEQSWEEFYKRGIDHFINGSFSGEYQAQLIAEFDRALPANPPWVEEPDV